jgi:hypothetical protein
MEEWLRISTTAGRWMSPMDWFYELFFVLSMTGWYFLDFGDDDPLCFFTCDLFVAHGGIVAAKAERKGLGNWNGTFTGSLHESGQRVFHGAPVNKNLPLFL